MLLHNIWVAAALILSGIKSVNAACSPAVNPQGSSSSVFWMEDANLHKNGKNPFNTNAGFNSTWLNVKTFGGAKGDGSTDDTIAINKTIAYFNRCGMGCNSSTIAPGLIYFPHGTYMVSGPIIPYYFTSLVGDYNTKPTIRAMANFSGIAIIDADPYYPGVVGPDGNGVNWWTNQNNFFRSVRNFVIDTTLMPATSFGTGIHWQVGQATSIINVDFKMNKAAGTKHQGIFAENGSGGFMSDLTFDGGAFGMWISNQQFTIRNVKITNAVSAIYQLWNWGFTWQGITIQNCQVGFDLATGGLTLGTQSAGSVLILDSSISNTGIGVRMSTSQASSLAGSLILDNVAFSGITGSNIRDSAGVILAASSSTIRQWFQGNVYKGTGSKTYTRGTYTMAPTKPTALLSAGAVFAKSRPQYNLYTSAQFISVKTVGKATGNGVTDDTQNIKSFISQNSGCGILYFDHGIYKVTDTIHIPPGTIIVGEMFSVILGSGAAFSNPANPKPILQVGNSGDVGTVEISDIVVSTVGGSAGAIGIQWNIAQSSNGAAGLWDVHIRLGGAKGTNIDLSHCPTTSTSLTACGSAFLGLHVTQRGSGYFENVWVWNADHDLDDPAQRRINSFSGRGILVESSVGPVWLVGTASEHHVIYQYGFLNTQNVYAGLIQTETPYFQPTPKPPLPFSTVAKYGDPSTATSDAYGLVVTNSANIFIYGAGLYSFFQTYTQACVDTKNCQTDMALIDSKSSAVYIYQLTTTGSTNMLTQSPSTALVKQADNVDGYASTATFWRSASDSVLVPTPPTDPTGPSGTPCSDVAGWASDWAQYTWDNYFEFSTDDNLGCGCFTTDESWERASGAEIMINYMWGAKDTDTFDLQNLYDIFFLANYPFIDQGYFGGGHDDALWGALAMIKWYEYKHDFRQEEEPGLLDSAKGLIDFVAEKRSDPTRPCPGGVYWKHELADGSKNVVTNSLFMVANARYYVHTGDTVYRDAAVDVWNKWAMFNASGDTDGIRASNMLYDDGTTTACVTNKDTQYTYNQGLMINAGAQLTLITGDSRYIDFVRPTLDAIVNGNALSTNGILAEGCDKAGSTCDTNGRSFKGQFMMHLQYFLDASSPQIQQQYGIWIGKQVRAIKDNAVSSGGDVGNIWWDKGAAQIHSAQTIAMAISAGSLAMKYGLHDDTFTC